MSARLPMRPSSCNSAAPVDWEDAVAVLARAGEVVVEVGHVHLVRRRCARDGAEGPVALVLGAVGLVGLLRLEIEAAGRHEGDLRLADWHAQGRPRRRVQLDGRLRSVGDDGHTLLFPCFEIVEKGLAVLGFPGLHSLVEEALQELDLLLL